MANEKVISTAALIDKFRQALADDWGYIWGTAGVKWTAARQEALEKTTDANRANSRKYGAKWIGHMVADCSGMFVWAFKQFGMGMSHISSNIYKSYCTSTKGRLTAELKQTIRPGSAVFTGDAPGNHPHVGLYIGNNTVIEEKGTQAGIITSNLTDKKWTFYGELKGVDYSGEQPAPAPAPEPAPAKLPTIRKGNRNVYVKQMQTILDKLGYSLGICGIDGDFGTATEKAVKEFQRDHKLSQDGVCGPKTWAALQEAADRLKPEPEATYTVTVRGVSKAVADDIVKKYGGTAEKI